MYARAKFIIAKYILFAKIKQNKTKQSQPGLKETSVIFSVNSYVIQNDFNISWFITGLGKAVDNFGIPKLNTQPYLSLVSVSPFFWDKELNDLKYQSLGEN